MSDFIEISHKQFETDIRNIETLELEPLKKAEQTIICVKQCLMKLKEYVKVNSFQSQKEEINFFKVIKPSIHGKLIYSFKVIDIESKRQAWCIETQKKNLQNELLKIEKYFKKHFDFYLYIFCHKTCFDDKYFLRNKVDLCLCSESVFYDIDMDFSTSHDSMVAFIQAYHMLGDYIKNLLDSLHDSGKVSLFQQKSLEGKYSWTDSKTALIELIYSIQALGCINNGKTDIKEIVLLCETVFNIELGDCYREYLQIKSRQNPTKFLDTLKNSLMSKIAQQDYI